MYLFQLIQLHVCLSKMKTEINYTKTKKQNKKNRNNINIIFKFMN